MWFCLFIHRNHKSNHKSPGLHTYNNLVCEWLQLINKEAQTADWFYLFLKQNKPKTHILQAARNGPVYPGNWNWEKAGTVLLSYKVGFTSKLVRSVFFLFVHFAFFKWLHINKVNNPSKRCNAYKYIYSKYWGSQYCFHRTNMKGYNMSDRTHRDGGWFGQYPTLNRRYIIQIKVNTESLRVTLLSWSNWASG